MATESPLRNTDFRKLFTAQVIALVGTGLTTIALTLLAYDLVGGNAGIVLGTALAFKMVAYVVSRRSLVVWRTGSLVNHC